jgi:hypothetical protein
MVVYVPSKEEESKRNLYYVNPVGVLQHLVAAFVPPAASAPMNSGRFLCSSTYATIWKPTENDRDLNLESAIVASVVAASYLFVQPSLRYGTRVFVRIPPGSQKKLATTKATVPGQVLTTAAVTPVLAKGTDDRVVRFDAQASNHHHRQQPHPLSDIFDKSKVLEAYKQKRSDVQTFGVDHAILLCVEGDFLWVKISMDPSIPEALFACVVIDSTQPLSPWCLIQSADYPGRTPVALKQLDLTKLISGLTVFSVIYTYIYFFFE